MFAGIIPFLLSLFGTAGGAAAAGTTAAETVPAAAGAGSGLLGGLFGSGSSGSLGGLLSLFGGGASAGPQQLSGPGMEGVTGAVGPGNGPQPAGASGGFNLGSLLGGGTMPGGGSGIQPPGQNMMADLMGGIGRSYMQGAMAGKGDFKGAAGLQAQHEQSVNQTARTGILQQESTQRQEQLDIQKAQQAKVDEHRTAIQGIFEKAGALDNLPEALANALPHLFGMGDHASATSVTNFLAKAATDKKTNDAMSNVSKLAQSSYKQDGTFDFESFNKRVTELGDPHATDAANKLRPLFTAEANVANQQGIRQEAGVREERIQGRNEQLSQQFQQSQERLASQFAEGQNRADARQQAQIQGITDRIMQHPLEGKDREAVATMEENQRIAKELKNGFTDAERKQWIGILKGPKAKAEQVAKENPRFARFYTLSNEVKGFAFLEGGKNLTETEKQVTWGHIPTGNEFSYENYMANLDRTLERGQAMINRRIDLATSPRTRIREQGGSTPNTPTGPAGSTGPRIGQVIDGHKFMGGDPADEKNWKKVKP